MGVVSCLGNDLDEVSGAQDRGRSGMRRSAEYAERGLRFMGDAAAYAAIAMRQTIEDSGLDPDQVSNLRTGLVAGSGRGGMLVLEDLEHARARGARCYAELIGVSGPVDSLNTHGTSTPLDDVVELESVRTVFGAGSANIDEVDPACWDFPILRETRRTRVDTVMSNSFGFGGANATLIVRSMPN